MCAQNVKNDIPLPSPKLPCSLFPLSSGTVDMLRLMVQPPTMMLLIGMWMSFTKKPMKPMMANPIAVAMAIF